MNNTKPIGHYNNKFNKLIEKNITTNEIKVCDGLKAHLKKNKHQDCIEYIPKLPELLKSPDYVGVNPNIEEESFQYVKNIDNKTILIGIKKDEENDYLYVATMYTIRKRRLKRLISNGRLKKVV